MSGRIQFDIDGNTHSLHFGMLAAEIFQNKGLQESLLVKQRGDKSANDIKAFAYIIHAGSCNYADISEKQYPSFEESYMLMESVCMQDKKLQEDIYACWFESRPTEQMFERLGIKTEKKNPMKKKKVNGLK